MIILSFLMIFLYSNFSQLVLAQEFTFTNVSPDLLTVYPKSISSPLCGVQIFVLVENKTLPINSLIGAGSLKIGETNVSALFLVFTAVDPATSFNMTVNGYNESYGYINILKNCVLIDSQSIKVDIIKDIFWNSLHKYSAIVRLNDVPDGSLLSEGYDGYTISFTLLGNSIYQIDYHQNYFIHKTSEDSIWSIDIGFPENQIVTISVPFNKSKNPSTDNDEIYDLQKYPTDTPSVQFSNIYGATVSFKSKTTLQRSPFTLFTLINPYFLTPRPISGNSNDGITYAVTCLSVYPSQEFYLYRQLLNSSYIDDNRFTLNVTILPSLKNSIIPDLTRGQVTDMDNSTSVSMISFGSDYIFPYDFKYYSFRSKGISDTKVGPLYGFPFGFTSGNNFHFLTNISIPIRETSGQLEFEFKMDFQDQGGLTINFKPFIYIGYDGTRVPKLISFDCSTYINQFKFLVRMHLVDQYGIKYINTVVDSIYYRWDSQYLVSGTIYDGIYEFMVDGALYSEAPNLFSAFNYLDQEQFFSINQPFNVDIPYNRVSFPSVKILSTNYIDDLTNVSFLYNNVHVTNQSVDNIIYFTFNGDIEQYKTKTIGFALNDPKTLVEERFSGDLVYSYIPTYHFAEWDQSKNRFSVKFKMPANTIPGFLEYSLTFTKSNTISSTILPSEYQLRVISPNIDIIGPMITKMVKNPSNTIGWLVTIEDDINGFDHGFVTVRGKVDSSLHNISLKASDAVIGSGDKWKANYLITIPLNIARCFPQEYDITYTWLVDSFNNVNKFFRYLTPIEKGQPIFFDATSNPFRAFLNDSTTLTTIANVDVCTTIDPTPPTLISFKATNSFMDVGLVNRSISFNFEAQDLDSGLKDGQFPVVYLLTQDMGSAECVSSIVNKTETNMVYTCTMDVPIGMGVGNNILVSVYGFINNGGYYSGFTSKQLKDLNQSWNIQMSPQYTTDAPIIKESTFISNFGGNLWLYGRGFKSIDTVTITYSDKVDTKPISTIIYDSAVSIKNVLATNQSFTVTLSHSIQTTVKSNIITIQPTLFYFNYTDPIYTQPPTQTPSTTPNITTVSPIPTNPPQKCKGNPECGGPNNGVCTEKGCHCISPWYGIDCTSKLVTVEPPPKNNTNPSIEIPIPNGPGSTTSSSTSGGSSIPPSQILFRSLISIVSLREIDFNGKVVKTFPFNDQWEYTEINTNTSKYETSLNVVHDKEPIKVTATLQWFVESSTVYFAGQTLEMNPSSIKYNIDFTSYPFESQLNYLQLVMSASLISPNNNICSSKQFGDTTSGDDSNFVKLQIDDHSVYGRFIKRAIIDEKIVSITNVLLDNSMNSIESSSGSISQSYIGITIPFFTHSVSIDPDFSVLIDSESANSDSENSICPKNSSGLSSPKIAGIAIGGTAFAAIIVVSVIYSVRKTKRDKKLAKKISNIGLKNK